MAVASLVLLLSEHREPRVRAAAQLYAVLTQLGFLALLVGLVVLSTSAGGADTFRAVAARAGSIPSGTRTAVELLTVVGFGSKCGLLPLHAWLPRAHPEAPSPVSALMSAGMVNLGIYGLLRFDVQLLGPGQRWFGVLLMVAGGLSGLYGVLQASIATDLKRLLAYSTIENMGLIILGLGAAVLLGASGLHALATVALAAALLHVLAHAAFKTVAFLAAGSVLAGTGLRDLDRMGGLARRMPATTVLFGVAALGACGLPLGAGFVSEWLLVQSLIHAPRTGDTVLALAMPLAVGAVALCTGLAVAAMVKALGVGFLARPRSDAAAAARESSPFMLAGTGVAAVACLVFALAPGVAARLLHRVLTGMPGVDVSRAPRLGAILRLPGAAGSISPVWLAVGLLGAGCGALALTGARRARRPAAVTLPLWACGAETLTPRMQYTASSFAEPLQRVFDDVLRPETDIEITHHAESRYLIERVAYRVRITDAVEERLYQPVLATVRHCADLVRRVHTGSVHLYLGAGAVGLLVVLVVAR
jgi:formate hydrogenlyase subunit 3/multisubunit Na+/H+ antiporter MnhD subunit